MHPYMMNVKESRGRCHYVADLWAPYKGMYPDPTPWEFNLIKPFLYKLGLEDDHFVEEENHHWISLKNRLQCPNLRCLLIKFLRQVRESKGYDVDLQFDFSGAGVGAFEHYTQIFVPRRLDEKKFYDQGMAATKFAIEAINANNMGGKTYELVSLDKFVSATNYSINNALLLTFTAKEIAANGVIQTFQAMLCANQIDATFQLKEWKFKLRASH